MSETAPETAESGGGFDGWSGSAEIEVWAPGEVVEQEVIDAEAVDDDTAAPLDDPQVDEVDGEVTDDSGWTAQAVEPWAVTDDPAAHGWGSSGGGSGRAPEPRQRETDGVRPAGGSRSGGGGGGTGAFSGRMTRKERKRRQKEAGGGGGDKVLIKIERRVNKTTNASLLDTRGAGSNNRLIDTGRSSRGSGGRSSRGSGGGSGGFGPRGTTIASKKGWRW